MTTVVAPLFSRQQLAAEIADPRTLTWRRAVSLAFRHYRLAQSEWRNGCEGVSCRHRDPEDCFDEVFVSHDRLEDAIAAFAHESVEFDMDDVLLQVRRHQDAALGRVRRHDGWYWAAMRDSLRRWPNDGNREQARRCIARKRAAMADALVAEDPRS